MGIKKIKYVVGAVIALGFYLVSMLLGAVLNVTVAITAGYRSYNAFINSGNIAGIIIILLIGVVNHLFFSWLTVRVMAKYVEKSGCPTIRYFRVAEMTVIFFAYVIIPILFSSNAGWLMYLTHAIGIDLFGKKYVTKNSVSDHSDAKLIKNTSAPQFTKESIIESQEPKPQTEYKANVQNRDTPLRSVNMADSKNQQDDISIKYFFCHICGNKISSDSIFCDRCGTKLKQED